MFHMRLKITDAPNMVKNYVILWFRNQWIRLNHVPLPEISYQKVEYEKDWVSPCSWNWRDPRGIYFLSPMIIKPNDPRDQ